ncbi:hypothetical protein [Rubritalea tangerina]
MLPFVGGVGWAVVDFRTWVWSIDQPAGRFQTLTLPSLRRNEIGPVRIRS